MVYQKLYRLGVRKIGVVNLPPLGNIPSARALAGGLTKEAAQHYNSAVEMFNTKLELEIQFLNIRLPQVKIVYIDLYHIMLDILHNKARYGKLCMFIYPFITVHKETTHLRKKNILGSFCMIDSSNLLLRLFSKQHIKTAYLVQYMLLT